MSSNDRTRKRDVFALDLAEERAGEGDWPDHLGRDYPVFAGPVDFARRNAGADIGDVT